MVAQLGFATMLDTMEFMRKSWNQLNLPAAFTPTMDVDELDRRIKELKAVEQWLNVNMNMLRSTIQALEVQRGTITALQAFGAAMTAPAARSEQKAPESKRTESFAPSMPTSSAGLGAGATASAAAAHPGGRGTRHEDGRPEAAPRKPASDDAGGAPAQAAAGTNAGPAIDASMLDPTTWWNLLQQQFQQVAGSALSGMVGALPPSSEADAGGKGRSGRGRGAAQARGSSRAGQATSPGDARKASARAAKRGDA